MAIRRQKQRSIEDNACGYGRRGWKSSGLHKNRIKAGRNERPVINDSRIGIASRDISPFVDNLLKSHPDVADFLIVPKNIFELDDLTEVLSYHTWETELSFSENLFLQQFLPKGTDADIVVKSLLTGENLHFGNSFTTWSASLFSGRLHPESILHNTQHLKSRKKDYLSRLYKYHYEMVNYLLEWKVFWESCENPEILKSMWSKGTRHPGYASSKKVMSDRRTFKKGNGNQIQVNGGNGDKYNSFFKINGRSPQLDKNANHSVVHIKSLNSNLGDMKNCSAEISMTHQEEERKIINGHWLNLACKDIPNTYKHFIKEKLLRVHCRKILKQELAGKHKMSQQDDCSIPYFECDNLEMPLVGDKLANGDSHASVEHQISEQKDGGELKNQSEVNLQVAENGSSIPHTNCDEFEKLPHNSYLDLTPMVLEEGLQSLTNPQLEQFSQIFLNCASKTTDNSSLQNILPLNNVQESRYFLPVNPKPLQLHGNIEQTMNAVAQVSQPLEFQGNLEETMNAVESKNNIPSVKNDGMGIGCQNSFIHSQSYLNAPVGGMSLDLLQEINNDFTTEMKSLLSDVGNIEPSNYIVSNLPSFGNQLQSQGGSFIPAPVSGRQSLHHNPHQQLNNLRIPVSSSAVSSNALQQQPCQLPIDFQQCSGRLCDLRIRRETLVNKSLAENKGFIFNSYLNQNHLSADVSRSEPQGFNKLWSGVVNPSLLDSQYRGNNNILFSSSIPQSRHIPSMHMYNSSYGIQLTPQDGYINMDGTLSGSDVAHGFYSNQLGIFGNYETSYNRFIAPNNKKLPNMLSPKVGRQDVRKQNSSKGKQFIQGTWNNE